MPIIKAAIKHLRQSEKHRTVNRSNKEELRQAMKEILKLASGKKFDEFKKKLPETMSIIDKSVKHNLIHKNNAAHKKARLSRLLAAAL